MSILSASRAAAAARAFICLAAVGLTFPNASATLIGDTVSITLDSPNGILGDLEPSPIFVTDNVLVSAATEIATEDSSLIGGGYMQGNEFIDFFASSIVLRVAGAYETPAGYHLPGYGVGGRYIFSGLDHSAGTITGLTFSTSGITNLPSLGSSWIRLSDAHTVIVELDKMEVLTSWAGTDGYADITINLQVTAVPEPGTAGMMLLGLGLLGLGLRKRQS